jgi:hypothetical protein
METRSLDSNTFLSIVQSVQAEFEPSMLELPFERTPLDSLDLLQLRASLEVHLGRTIDDQVWMGAPSAAALLEVLA